MTTPDASSAPGHQVRTLEFTETQGVIMGIWLGLPVVAFLLLWLINPRYEQELFGADFIITRTLFLGGSIIAELVNTMTLYTGFRLINRFLPLEGSRRFWRVAFISLLSTLTFLLFTLPALWVVLLGPAMIMFMQGAMNSP